MKKTILTLSLGIGAMLLATQHAFAQQQPRNCGERAKIVTRLSEGYGETRQSMGLGANNAVIEIYASQDTGTWTITVTMPNGVTCLVASGQAYEAVQDELVPSGMAL